MKEFTRDKITLLNCDCLKYMKDIPDNHFDLAIVDPPYGIGANKMTLGNEQIFKFIPMVFLPHPERTKTAAIIIRKYWTG